MSTEADLIRLLELADPALVDDPTPVLDPAEYRDALNTRSTTVTPIDAEPAPTQPTGARRWPTIIAAAAVVLMVVGALVLVARDDASEPQVPAGPPADPSAGSGLIAFVGSSAESESAEIYVVALDGTGLRALTSTPDVSEMAPAWSPDGTRLAFLRNVRNGRW